MDFVEFKAKLEELQSRNRLVIDEFGVGSIYNDFRQHLTSVLENKSDMVYELERICRLAMKVYVEMRIERITRLTVADDLGKSIFTESVRLWLGNDVQEMANDNPVKVNFRQCVDECFERIKPEPIATFFFMLQFVLINNWEHPILSSMMTNTVTEEEKATMCLAYLRCGELPESIKVRVEILIRGGGYEPAYNLVSWCLKSPLFSNDVDFNVVRLLLHQKLTWEFDHLAELLYEIPCCLCSRMGTTLLKASFPNEFPTSPVSALVGLFPTEEAQSMCTHFVTSRCIDDWTRSKTYCCTKSLLELWLFLQNKQQPDSLLDDVTQIYNLATCPKQKGLLASALRSEIFTPPIQSVEMEHFVAEMLLSALRDERHKLDSARVEKDEVDTEEAALELVGLCLNTAQVYRHNSKLSLSACLTAFYVEPTVDTFRSIEQLLIQLNEESERKLAVDALTEQNPLLTGAGAGVPNREMNDVEPKLEVGDHLEGDSEINTNDLEDDIMEDLFEVLDMLRPPEIDVNQGQETLRIDLLEILSEVGFKYDSATKEFEDKSHDPDACCSEPPKLEPVTRMPEEDKSNEPPEMTSTDVETPSQASRRSTRPKTMTPKMAEFDATTKLFSSPYEGETDEGPDAQLPMKRSRSHSVSGAEDTPKTPVVRESRSASPERPASVARQPAGFQDAFALFLKQEAPATSPQKDAPKPTSKKQEKDQRILALKKFKPFDHYSKVQIAEMERRGIQEKARQQRKEAEKNPDNDLKSAIRKKTKKPRDVQSPPRGDANSPILLDSPVRPQRRDKAGLIASKLCSTTDQQHLWDALLGNFGLEAGEKSFQVFLKRLAESSDRDTGDMDPRRRHLHDVFGDALKGDKVYVEMLKKEKAAQNAGKQSQEQLNDALTRMKKVGDEQINKMVAGKGAFNATLVLDEWNQVKARNRVGGRKRSRGDAGNDDSDCVVVIESDDAEVINSSPDKSFVTSKKAADNDAVVILSTDDEVEAMTSAARKNQPTRSSTFKKPRLVHHDDDDMTLDCRVFTENDTDVAERQPAPEAPKRNEKEEERAIRARLRTMELKIMAKKVEIRYRAKQLPLAALRCGMQVPVALLMDAFDVINDITMKASTNPDMYIPKPLPEANKQEDDCKEDKCLEADVRPPPQEARVSSPKVKEEIQDGDTEDTSSNNCGEETFKALGAAPSGKILDSETGNVCSPVVEEPVTEDDVELPEEAADVKTTEVAADVIPTETFTSEGISIKAETLQIQSDAEPITSPMDPPQDAMTSQDHVFVKVEVLPEVAEAVDFIVSETLIGIIGQEDLEQKVEPELDVKPLINKINIDSPFKCRYCSLLTSSASHRRRHEEWICSVRERFYCPHCEKCYMQKDPYQLHLLRCKGDTAKDRSFEDEDETVDDEENDPTYNVSYDASYDPSDDEGVLEEEAYTPSQEKRKRGGRLYDSRRQSNAKGIDPINSRQKRKKVQPKPVEIPACTYCKGQFESKKERNKHMETCSYQSTAPVPCPLCGKMQEGIHRLREHVFADHRGVTTDSATILGSIVTDEFVILKVRQIVCRQCGHKTANLNKMQIHQQEICYLGFGISNCIKYMCPKCEEAFRLRTKCEVHVKACSSVPKILTCKVCGLLCLNRESFERHMAVHDISAAAATSERKQQLHEITMSNGGEKTISQDRLCQLIQDRTQTSPAASFLGRSSGVDPQMPILQPIKPLQLREHSVPAFIARRPLQDPGCSSQPAPRAHSPSNVAALPEQPTPAASPSSAATLATSSTPAPTETSIPVQMAQTVSMNQIATNLPTQQLNHIEVAGQPVPLPGQPPPVDPPPLPPPSEGQSASPQALNGVDARNATPTPTGSSPVLPSKPTLPSNSESTSTTVRMKVNSKYLRKDLSVKHCAISTYKGISMLKRKKCVVCTNCEAVFPAKKPFTDHVPQSAQGCKLTHDKSIYEWICKTCRFVDGSHKAVFEHVNETPLCLHGNQTVANPSFPASESLNSARPVLDAHCHLASTGRTTSLTKCPVCDANFRLEHIDQHVQRSHSMSFTMLQEFFDMEALRAAAHEEQAALEEVRKYNPATAHAQSAQAPRKQVLHCEWCDTRFPTEKQQVMHRELWCFASTDAEEHRRLCCFCEKFRDTSAHALTDHVRTRHAKEWSVWLSRRTYQKKPRVELLPPPPPLLTPEPAKVTSSETLSCNWCLDVSFGTPQELEEHLSICHQVERRHGEEQHRHIDDVDDQVEAEAAAHLLEQQQEPAQQQQQRSLGHNSVLIQHLTQDLRSAEEVAAVTQRHDDVTRRLVQCQLCRADVDESVLRYHLQTIHSDAVNFAMKLHPEHGAEKEEVEAVADERAETPGMVLTPSEATQEFQHQAQTGSAMEADHSPAEVTSSSAASAAMECPKCHKTFKFRSRFSEHMRSHSGERPFVCPITGCVKAFKYKPDVILHYLRHHKNISMGCKQCPECGLFFETTKAVISHFKDQHPGKIEAPVELQSLIQSEVAAIRNQGARDSAQRQRRRPAVRRWSQDTEEGAAQRRGGGRRSADDQQGSRSQRHSFDDEMPPRHTQHPNVTPLPLEYAHLPNTLPRGYNMVDAAGQRRAEVESMDIPVQETAAPAAILTPQENFVSAEDTPSQPHILTPVPPAAENPSAKIPAAPLPEHICPSTPLQSTPTHEADTDTQKQLEEFHRTQLQVLAAAAEQQLQEMQAQEQAQLEAPPQEAQSGDQPLWVDYSALPTIDELYNSLATTDMAPADDPRRQGATRRVGPSTGSSTQPQSRDDVTAEERSRTEDEAAEASAQIQETLLQLPPLQPGVAPSQAQIDMIVAQARASRSAQGSPASRRPRGATQKAMPAVNITPNVHVNPAGKTTYSCNYCDKIFTFRSKFEEHLPVHSDARPHVCTICERTYKYKHDLHIHMGTHLGVAPKSKTCTYCSKIFQSNKELRGHVEEEHSHHLSAPSVHTSPPTPLSGPTAEMTSSVGSNSACDVSDGSCDGRQRVPGTSVYVDQAGAVIMSGEVDHVTRFARRRKTKEDSPEFTPEFAEMSQQQQHPPHPYEVQQPPSNEADSLSNNVVEDDADVLNVPRPETISALANQFMSNPEVKLDFNAEGSADPTAAEAGWSKGVAATDYVRKPDSDDVIEDTSSESGTSSGVNDGMPRRRRRRALDQLLLESGSQDGGARGIGLRSRSRLQAPVLTSRPPVADKQSSDNGQQPDGMLSFIAAEQTMTSQPEPAQVRHEKDVTPPERVSFENIPKRTYSRGGKRCGRVSLRGGAGARRIIGVNVRTGQVIQAGGSRKSTKRVCPRSPASKVAASIIKHYRLSPKKPRYHAPSLPANQRRPVENKLPSRPIEAAESKERRPIRQKETNQCYRSDQVTNQQCGSPFIGEDQEDDFFPLTTATPPTPDSVAKPDSSQTAAMEPIVRANPVKLGGREVWDTLARLQKTDCGQGYFRYFFLLLPKSAEPFWCLSCARHPVRSFSTWDTWAEHMSFAHNILCIRFGPTFYDSVTSPAVVEVQVPHGYTDPLRAPRPGSDVTIGATALARVRPTLPEARPQLADLQRTQAVYPQQRKQLTPVTSPSVQSSSMLSPIQPSVRENVPVLTQGPVSALRPNEPFELLKLPSADSSKIVFQIKPSPPAKEVRAYTTSVSVSGPLSVTPPQPVVTSPVATTQHVEVEPDSLSSNEATYQQEKSADIDLQNEDGEKIERRSLEADSSDVTLANNIQQNLQPNAEVTSETAESLADALLNEDEHICEKVLTPDNSVIEEKQSVSQLARRPIRTTQRAASPPINAKPQRNEDPHLQKEAVTLEPEIVPHTEKTPVTSQEDRRTLRSRRKAKDKWEEMKEEANKAEENSVKKVAPEKRKRGRPVKRAKTEPQPKPENQQQHVAAVAMETEDSIETESKVNSETKLGSVKTLRSNPRLGARSRATEPEPRKVRSQRKMRS